MTGGGRFTLGASRAVPPRADRVQDRRRPLAGCRIVVTRPAPAASAPDDPLVKRLRDSGAQVLVFPAIRLAPPRRWAPVDRAIRALHTRSPAPEVPGPRSQGPRSGAVSAGYAWVVFLSANGVERFLGRIRTLGLGERILGSCRLAAIGPATARAMAARGLRPDVVAGASTSAGLARALRGKIGRGDRVLLPRADIGREILPAMLRRRGAQVDEVTVYRTLPAKGGPVASLRRALASGAVDLLTFASAQTVRNFAAAVGRGVLRRMSRGVRIVTIGPVTSAACRSAGLRVHAEAGIPSFEGLVRAAAGLLAP